MLTNEDIQKLASILATKEDIKELRQDVDGLRETVQALAISVDGLVKAVTDLNTEYASVKNQLNRHEKWLQQVAEKLDIKLEY